MIEGPLMQGHAHVSSSNVVVHSRLGNIYRVVLCSLLGVIVDLASRHHQNFYGQMLRH